jgi:hypothetical protein
MTIKAIEEITIFESTDGGKTVYARRSGETERHLHVMDEAYAKEQKLSTRWVNLKDVVFMAENDKTLDDALSKVEMLYQLKKQVSTY